MQHPRPHRRDDRLHPLRDVAVAHQSHGAGADVADGLTEAGVGGPPPAGTGVAVQFQESAHRGQHQQHGSLGGRRRVGAGHVGHRDVQFGGRVDLDGVHSRAQLVHQAQPGTPPEVIGGQWPQYVPHHIGPGQFAVQGDVVLLVAPADIQPVRFGRNDFQNRVGGQEVRQDPNCHRGAGLRAAGLGRACSPGRMGAGGMFVDHIRRAARRLVATPTYLP